MARGLRPDINSHVHAHTDTNSYSHTYSNTDAYTHTYSYAYTRRYTVAANSSSGDVYRQ